MTEIIIGGFSLSIVLIVLLEALKRIGLTNKFIPLVALGLGVLASLLYMYSGNEELTVINAVVLGIMSGATASGLYSQGKIYKPTKSE